MTYHLGLGSVPIASLPAQSQLGQIRSKSGRVYQITPEDVLWLTRSARYEGGNHAATLWTYAQRLIAFNSQSLAALVRAHSQPVNPRWRRDGEFCAPGGQYHGNDLYCSEAQLARRDEAATIPWTSLPASLRTLVVEWAQAKVDNPVPRATDFANARVSQSFLSRNPGAGIVLQEGNWYLYEARSASWPVDQVVITYNGKTSAVSTFVGLPSWAPWAIAGGAAALLVGGAAAIAFSMRGKRRR